ncbi:hypothetical protein [Cupriavidus necator]|uniref:hypothetical protein n=1 Tax=Cupriavidus necator TaxID=106590 RepID=UPI0006908F00|nr:hypothetical protein [Cupriavidus necator]
MINSANNVEPRIDILRSPFAVLGATTRDNRKTIIELADKASLSLDYDLCQKARADLTNPRIRLNAEIGWLPSVSPHMMVALIDAVRSDPMSLIDRRDLPALAHCNVLTAAFEAVDERLDWERLVDLIEQMAYLVDGLDAPAILRQINEDRALSMFPEVRGVDQVEEELVDRKRHYRKVIQDTLNRLSTEDRINVMTFVVEGTTMYGKAHAPQLVDDLVDSYAVETQDFLQKEAANIEKLTSAAREKADAPEAVLASIVGALDNVVRNWCKFARPLLVSLTSRGRDHDSSARVANSVRSLAIDLFNDHDRLEQACQLTLLLKEMFECLPEFLERVKADEAVLKNIAEKRAAQAALKSLQDLCVSVKEMVERDPTVGFDEGTRVLLSGMPLMREAGIAQNTSRWIEGCNYMAITAMLCAVAYGKKTSKWDSCIGMLARARQIASDEKIKERLDVSLEIARENASKMADAVRSLERQRKIETPSCGHATVRSDNEMEKAAHPKEGTTARTEAAESLNTRANHRRPWPKYAELNMTVIVKCPRCDQGLRVPAGKLLDISCRTCNHTFRKLTP